MIKEQENIVFNESSETFDRNRIMSA